MYKQKPRCDDYVKTANTEELSANKTQFQFIKYEVFLYTRQHSILSDLISLKANLAQRVCYTKLKIPQDSGDFYHTAESFARIRKLQN